MEHETDNSESRLPHSEPAEGHEGEERLRRCCAALACDESKALEIIEWADEEYGSQNEKLKIQNPEVAVLMASFFKILDYFFRHPNLIRIYAVLYSFGAKVPLLDDIIGHHYPKSFAAAINVEREAVNRVVLEVQKEFGLPSRQGQRGAVPRENMRLARLAQLKVQTEK